MRSVHSRVAPNQSFIVLAIVGLLVSLCALGFTPAQAYAADITVNGSTATVYSAAGLKSAVENKAVDTIEFANDIAVTNSAQKKMTIAPNRTNANLTIDGKGYTFTEWYDKSYDSCAGLQLTGSGNLKNITVKDMNIVGGNGYGTIYTTAKEVKQSFENVTYNGPQMVYNPKGSLSLTNCDITLNYAQGKGSYLGELAEITRVDLAGIVNITKKPKSSDEIFWIKESGGGIFVADGAQVNVVNEHGSNSGKSGFIWASCSYDLVIGNGAAFSYTGSKVFEETCCLNNFTVGTDARFVVNITSALECTLLGAKNIEVGARSLVDIDIDGKAGCEVFVSKYDMNIRENATVDIDIAGKNCCSVVKSACKDINLSEGANVFVNIDGEVCCCVVYVPCGSISLAKDSNMIVYSNGKLGCPLMKICKDLYVGEGATLDLIALNNNNGICCTYVFVADGCNKLTYDNPNRVLFYNSCTNTSCSKAACLGCDVTIDFDVYSTRYWFNSNTTGGHDVLANPDRDWSQNSNYQVNAFAKTCDKFKTFDVQNYNGTIDPNQYYFGTKAYQVCLWQGKGAVDPLETYTLTYLPNDAYLDDLYPGNPAPETYPEGTEVPVANSFYDDYAEWDFVGWSTYQDVNEAAAAGFIQPGANLTLTEDTVLYAHWKSRTPKPIPIKTSATARTATGNQAVDYPVSVGAEILVVCADNSEARATVAANGSWMVNVPAGNRYNQYDFVNLYQTELNKLISDPVRTQVGA